MDSNEQEQYYLVRKDLLPDGMLKTVQAKKLLVQGAASTIHEAVEQVGLSRSAFYKYKDGVHIYFEHKPQTIINIAMELQHRSGILSKVLAKIASLHGNVLTIHQTIPIQGKAQVTISLDTSLLNESEKQLMEEIHQIEGVSRVFKIDQNRT
jgi:chorismate mutase